MEKSEQIGNLAQALSVVQGKMQAAQKDGKARISSQKGSYEYKYISFEEVWNVARALLAENELSVAQLTDTGDHGEVIVESILMHKSGEWLSGKIKMPVSQNTPQAIGSAITYARRYGFSALIGIVADEDDDAQKAMPQGANRSAGDQTKNRQQNPPKPNPPRAETPPPSNVASIADRPPKSIREYAMEADEAVKLNPRELKAVQIVEAVKEGVQASVEYGEDHLGKRYKLYYVEEDGSGVEYSIRSQMVGGVSCNCDDFISITKSHNNAFKCEHIMAIAELVKQNLVKNQPNRGAAQTA